MSKHTPGPWTVKEQHNQIDDFADEEVGSVAYEVRADFVHATVASFISYEEDARLIAAAPELLAALETIMAGVAGVQREPQWEAARAAIAKATGEVA